jgi:hypothetical protein
MSGITMILDDHDSVFVKNMDDYANSSEVTDRNEERLLGTGRQNIFGIK